MLSQLNAGMNKAEITLSRLGKPYLGRMIRSDTLHPTMRVVYLKRGRVLFVDRRITLFQADYLTDEQKNFWLFLIPYLLDTTNELGDRALDSIDKAIEVDSIEMITWIKEAFQYYGDKLRKETTVDFIA